MRLFVCILFLILPAANLQAARCCPADAENKIAVPPSTWAGDLTAIDPGAWNEATVKHLAERAGFGAPPSEIKKLAGFSPEAAIDQLMMPVNLPAFEHSGVHDPGLEPFPPSRPATTTMARNNGEALGVKVKPSGNRRLQPVVNKFFYWLRASKLETDRLAYWWAQRMLDSPAQLREKMALFWHGHFAVNEGKVRDYRKHLQLLEVFHQHGLGSFRELLIEVAKSPAMLSFLDAGVNVKGSPNENFAREIMELFTMGPGHYTEEDIREAARAFTGWNYDNLDFVINPADQDTGSKTFLGKTGNFNGIEIIDIILEQPATATFLVSKIYRYFVHENPSPEVINQLAATFRNSNYNIEELMKAIFLSRDFYSAASVGNHIKSPVELVVSTYRKLELNRIPGIPGLNQSTTELGQHLFNPPTVAGWAQGKAWITPGLLIARTNFAYDLLYPDIKHIAYDRYSPRKNIRDVSIRLEAGANITEATSGASEKADEVSMANRMADMDQDFNTRYGSYRGWQMAIERVKPIPRHTAGLNLVALVRASEAETLEEVVDHFAWRLLAVPLSEEQRSALVQRLRETTGTNNLNDTWTYLEDPLRDLVFAMMSLPEYQLG